MKKIRQRIDDMSVKKKLVVYGYLTIAPVLIVICIVLLFYNYYKTCDENLKNDRAGVETLAESLSILQTDIKDFSTYICINQDIHELLTTEETEEKNRNAKLWLEEAPMEIVQDMMVWKSIPKGSNEVYETNRSDKIVLCREIFDLTQKKTLGYIVIGVSQEYFSSLCENIVKNDRESVLILDKSGAELIRAGSLDPQVEAYLQSEDFINQNYRTREDHFVSGNYEVICTQKEKNASIVCKIVPRYGLQMQILDIAYMPLILLFGMLIGLMPLLLIISNIVTRPLSRLTVAINKVSNGDFDQQVEVTTHDEVGEVAECFNKMVQDIKSLIEENYVITLAEKESELAALQAQINPHFLYNTLDSLYWQATEAGNDEIAESILALSQLFRLVLSQGKREVSVSQEMELVSRYLQIQKMRFTKRLDYEVTVDPAIQKARSDVGKGTTVIMKLPFEEEV